MQLEVSLTQLFSNRRLANFAALVQQARTNVLPALTPVERNGKPLELSFAQQRLWFLAQMGVASQAYHIHGGVRLRGNSTGQCCAGY